MFDSGGGGGGSDDGSGGSGSSYFSGAEKVYWGIQIGIFLWTLLLTVPLPEETKLVTKIFMSLTSYGTTKVLVNWAFFAKGLSSSFWPLVRSILSILHPLAKILRKVLTWWQWIAFGAVAVG